jgi:two-component system nitrate/nitrite response regulator NarL
MYRDELTAFPVQGRRNPVSTGTSTAPQRRFGMAPGAGAVRGLDGGAPTRFGVLVALGDELGRRGLTAMLADIPQVRAVVSCATGTDAIGILGGGGFEVVLSGCEQGVELATVAGRSAGSGVKLLVLLPDLSDQTLAAAGAANAHGFVLLTGLTSEVLDQSLGYLAQGGIPLPPELTLEMLSRFGRANSGGRPSGSALTPREHQILCLLADGLSNKQIASHLRISLHGAKRHVANVLAKLNCSNRTLAVAHAVRTGLIGGAGHLPN